jgi:protein-S-isoprenylcysteine O-methyltransferase Ste14
MSLETARDLGARAAVIALYTLLSVNLLSDFLATGRITGLLLLTSEALVVVFTVVRRPARSTDRSILAGVITIVSLAGPPLLRPANVESLLPDLVTASISGIGLGLVIAGKLTLGRSFGIAPANRGTISRGPYNLVRHPIYAGYLLTHIAFFLANPRPWNAVVVLIGDTALIVRALVEERVLASDVEYQAYCRRVGWHLVPGLF